MTYEELKKVPFKVVCHLNMTHEHTVTYISEDGRIGYCDHVKVRGGRPTGKQYRHWRIDGKVYKTNAAFFAALKKYNPIKDTL